MSTAGVKFEKPVNTPVYNVRRDAIEATLKASQGATKEVVARELFIALQKKGQLPADASFSDYQASFMEIIKDEDKDGYYDVKLADLNRILGTTSAPVRCEVLQASPLLETYFADSVSLSTAAKKDPETPLASLSYKDALAYFKKKYGQGPWDEVRLRNFEAEVQAYFKAHFTDVPVTTVEEAADAVNDSLPEPSDDLFSQMSKDGQGRVRGLRSAMPT